jgi:hypothetical protein
MWLVKASKEMKMASQRLISLRVLLGEKKANLFVNIVSKAVYCNFLAVWEAEATKSKMAQNKQYGK